MTEVEWLSCTDVCAMIDELQRRGMSDDRWRLFAVGCSRLVWDLLVDVPADRAGVEVADRYARGQATLDELHAAYMAITGKPVEAPAADNFPPAHATADYRFHDAVNEARGAAAFVEEYLPLHTAQSELCELLREVAGNPFRPAKE
jgi:hypothetical protein